MSTMLSMIEAGWESVLALAGRGRRAEALDRLTRLLARPDMPAARAAEGRRLAGELALELEKYALARCHLKAAAALEPDHAGTRYAMGRAWEEDPDGCDRRAAVWFKKAVTLDLTNSLYRAAFGRAAARCGSVKHGTREMLAAAEAAADDLAVVRVVVGGLLEANRVNEARSVLAKARFLCSGNVELAGMWERVKFESARLAQRQTARQTARQATRAAETDAATRYAQDALFATDGGRVTLPFLRLVGSTDGNGTAGSASVRWDPPSSPRPHFARLRARKADR